MMLEPSRGHEQQNEHEDQALFRSSQNENLQEAIHLFA